MTTPGGFSIVNNQFVESVLLYLSEMDHTGSIEITPDTDLIETGIVDSFSITQLILFVEETLSIEINLDDPTLDSIRTVRRINMTYNTREA